MKHHPTTEKMYRLGMSILGKVIFLIAGLQTFSQTTFAEGVSTKTSLVKITNVAVSNIIKAVKNKKFESFQIGDTSEEDGIPVTIFYHTGATIRAIEVIASHTVWTIQFNYYFDKQGILLKHLQISSLPGNPSREANIYYKGKLIWSNMDEVRVPASKMVRIFRNTIGFNAAFAKY